MDDERINMDPRKTVDERSKLTFEKFLETFDLTIPHECTAVYIASNLGTDIQEEEKFQEEFHEIVDKMKEEMVNETRILEGTTIKPYEALVEEVSTTSPSEEK